MFYLDGMGWLVNRTPHTVVVDIDGVRVEIPVGGEPIRLAENRTNVAPMLDLVSYQLSDLPEPAYGPDGSQVRFIVSNPVAQAAAAAGRKDFVAPDTGKGAIRDGDGKIVAVRGFICFF